MSTLTCVPSHSYIHMGILKWVPLRVCPQMSTPSSVLPRAYPDSLTPQMHTLAYLHLRWVPSNANWVPSHVYPHMRTLTSVPSHTSGGPGPWCPPRAGCLSSMPGLTAAESQPVSLSVCPPSRGSPIKGVAGKWQVGGEERGGERKKNR